MHSPEVGSGPLYSPSIVHEQYLIQGSCTFLCHLVVWHTSPVPSHGKSASHASMPALFSCPDILQVSSLPTNRPGPDATIMASPKANRILTTESDGDMAVTFSASWIE